MTFDQIVFASVVAVLGAGATAGIGAAASRHFGLPGLARQVDSVQADLIDALEGRLKIAEAVADEAKAEASAARAGADETERRRRRCEEEIGRVRRDLRNTEAELLDLYRRTGTPTPSSLVIRHRDRDSESESEDQT